MKAKLQLGDAYGYAVILRVGEYQKEGLTQYRVKLSCCGKEITMTHKQILAARAKGQKSCRACDTKNRTGRARETTQWTKAEDAIVTRMYPRPDTEISKSLEWAGYDRSPNAIKHRLTQKLGLVGEVGRNTNGAVAAGSIRIATGVEIPPPSGPGVWVGRAWWPSLTGPMGR